MCCILQKRAKRQSILIYEDVKLGSHVLLVAFPHTELVTLRKVKTKWSSHECKGEPHKQRSRSLWTVCQSQIVKFSFRGEAIIPSTCLFSLLHTRQMKGELVQLDFKTKLDFYEDIRVWHFCANC